MKGVLGLVLITTAAFAVCLAALKVAGTVYAIPVALAVMCVGVIIAALEEGLWR